MHSGYVGRLQGGQSGPLQQQVHLYCMVFTCPVYHCLFSAAHMHLIGSFLHLSYKMCLCPHPADFSCVGGGASSSERLVCTSNTTTDN